MNRRYWANSLVVPLYRDKIFQTPYNTTDPKFTKKGWFLKNKMWAPWFLNLRLLGEFPHLFVGVCRAMADLVMTHVNDIDVLIGVEMAGIPLVGGTVQALMDHYVTPVRFGYTRPLPEKVRTPKEALDMLGKMTPEVAGFGQKSYVEGVLRDKDRVAIFDDMSTGLASKIIARSIVLWEAEQRGVKIGECRKVLYFLNRNTENRVAGVAFQNDIEELHPTALDVDYVLDFDVDCLPQLETVMHASEYALIRDYQNDPTQFQDTDVQNDVLAQVAKDLGLTN